MNNALAAILQILNLIEAGAVTAAQLAALRAKVEGMVAAGRDPTADEWSALFADIDAQTEALAAADVATHSG
jgi:hypothetical protein